ncbi:UPAR/Ly6 domain-containing protein crok [Prorops nasuta]|uniref:UPAR/Ly6 domain-containing protein crok n=1 Tax=Prorops nasuta TaxID=863751 RepID=UPI0034CD20EF
MKHFHVLICSVLLLLCFYGGDAMKCYLCNSHNDSQCESNPPPESLKKDCSDLKDGAKYTMCRKITQVVEFSVNGLPANTRIIRGCGWDESHYKGKCYQRSGFGGRQEVCSCLTDFCNTATPGSLPPKSLIFTLAFGLLFLVLPTP